MKKILLTMLTALLCLGSMHAQSATGADAATQAEAAKAIINDFMASGGAASGSFAVNVTIDPSLKNGDKDYFQYTKTGSSLDITATNGVSACRAFYDFVKSNGAGICSWSANRFDAQEATNATASTSKTVTSAYRDHQYFNVVTYGYSTPYWDTNRWDKEIMWMALHGIDMPLMLVGSEGIYFDTFKAFGCTDEEIHSWEVGPAHLPWMRMGNLAGSKFDGPLNQSWYDNQKKLAHHILKKMYALGMRPILPAFGGFVPPAFQDHNDCGTLAHTGWDWVISRQEFNTRLNPDSEFFVQVGQEFIKRWEAEFHESYPGMKYYLSDSFNEMTVPGATELRTYGEKIFESINGADKTNNPGVKRVWVTQGWEFGYGSGKWTNGSTHDEKFKALAGNIPYDQFMVLYMSPEYGGYNNAKWSDDYDGFGGWEWINTMLPNMGGKNFWTGKIEDYANTFPQRMASSAKLGNLKGWGMTMEGIEYNELLYELIADMGWESMSNGHSVDNWVAQYGKARYGETAYSQALQTLHRVLRENVYSSYKDHQTFGWQGYNRKSGYYTPGNIDYLKKSFFTGMETFFSADNVAELKRQPLSATLRADLIEFAAFYAAARVENINKRIISAANMNKKEDALGLLADLKKVMFNMDRILSAHPLYDLQKWEDKAKAAAGDDEALQKQYVRDARSIVSTWHSGHGENAGDHEAVNDYAGRIWAGLIRGYYYPRLEAELLDKINKTTTNLRTVENGFVSTAAGTDLLPVQMQNASGEWVSETVETALSKATDAELLDFLQQLVADAQEAGQYAVSKENLEYSTLDTDHWYAIHTQSENYLERVFTSTGTQTDIKAGFGISDLGANDAQYWRIIQYGDGTVRLENRNGQSLMFENNTYKTTLVNVGTDVNILPDQGQGRYAFKLATASNYMNYDGSLKTAAAQNADNSFVTNSTWTLESADAKVNEISRQSDYDRYRNRVSGFAADIWGSTQLYGSLGQPNDEAALTTMVGKLSSRDADDPLNTYTDFLVKIYAKNLKEQFRVPEENTSAYKLFDLIMSAMQLRPSEANPDASATFREAMIAAQQTVATGTEEACTAGVTTLRNAINAYYEAIAPQKVTSSAKLANGNKYVLKNVSSQRNACLIEESNDGNLHIVSDVSRDLSVDSRYVFTLEETADGVFKLRTRSGKYIPTMTTTVTQGSSATGSDCKSSANGDTFTFTYVGGNNPYWKIGSASNAGKFLYNFGPGYQTGRLLWAGDDNKVTDGGMWEIYLVSEAPKAPTGDVEKTIAASEWQNAAFGDATAASSKTNFYSGAYMDLPVTVTGTAGTLSLEISYVNGSHAQNMYGIQLLQEGSVVKEQLIATPRTVGGNPKTQTFSVSSVDAGEYTVRVWTSATKNRETLTANGTVVLKKDGTQVGEQKTWNKNSWTLDNEKLPADLKTDQMPKIGVTLDNGQEGARYYRYLDQEMTFQKETTLTVTINSTDASKKMELIGVELLKRDNLETADGTYDGHYAIIGQTATDDCTYTVTIPAGGTYTVRTWAGYVLNEVVDECTVSYTSAKEPVSYKIIRHANPDQSTKHLNVAPNGTATNISATEDFRSLWTLKETGTEGQYKLYNEYTNKYLKNTAYNALCTMTDNENDAAVVAVASVTPASSQPTAGMTDVVSLTNTATNRYLFNNAEQNTNAYFGFGGSTPSNSWGCQFIIEDFDMANAKTWAQNLLSQSAEEGYVGTLENTEAMQALREAVQNDEQITPNLYRAAEESPKLTIDTEKFYVIESAINPNIWMYRNADSGNKMRYANKQYFDKRFVFRFAEPGKETSSNWGTSQEYDTYKIYCVGADQKGYVNSGSWNSAVTTGNSSDAKAYKLAEVSPAVFQLSAKFPNDNCTLAIGNNNTSVADNGQGDIVSWNIYNNRALTNQWRIREVEAPEAFALETVTISAAGAATYFFAKEVSIPEGIKVKYLTAADAHVKETQDPGIYALTYKQYQDVVPSGSAVVLIGEPAQYVFKSTMRPSDYIESAAASESNLLFGYVSQTANTDAGDKTAGLFALAQPAGYRLGFYPFVGENFKSKKAYLNANALADLPTIGDDGALVKGFMIFEEENSETTGVNAVEQKLRNVVIYDLTGRRLAAPVKGINIVNGKKVVVK